MATSIRGGKGRPNAARRWEEGMLAWLTIPNAGATHLVRVVANWGRYSKVSVESVAKASDSSRLRITVRPRLLHDVPPRLKTAWSMLPLN